MLQDVIKKLIQKIIAGAAVIALDAIGNVVLAFAMGQPMTDIEIQAVLLATSWQIWDNVIVPAIENLKKTDKRKTASMALSSLRLLG